MLFETLPVVSAQDIVLSDVDVNVTENSNVEHNEYIEQDSSQDILDNNDSIANNIIEDNSDNDIDIEKHEDVNVSSMDDIGFDDETLEEIESVFETNEGLEELISESIPSDDVNGVENSLVAKSGVLEITLADGEFVPDLTGNPDGYDTIRVTTTGNKKLVQTDYNRLRTSQIPNVDLSQSVSDSIPAGAFANATHLTSFQFPQGIKSIDSPSSSSNGAFYNCSGLTGDLIIPNSVTSIGDSAFPGCKGFTGNLIIPNSVTSIGNNAFYGCSGFTGDLITPDSVEAIGTNAFKNCSNINNFILEQMNLLKILIIEKIFLIS